MRKLYITAVLVLLLCILTACTQVETMAEDVYDPVNVSSETDSLGGASKVILAGSAGTTITQNIEGADGRIIAIDAEVCVDGISRVSYYRYVPQPITDEFRKDLLKRMYPAETWDVNDAVVYDKEKDTWEFVTPLGENWIYQVRDSQIPGEQILNHERVGIALDASKDNLLGVVLIQNDAEDPRLIELLGTLSTEIDQIGKMAIDSVMETDNYYCSDIYIYGNNGRQPYARAVFKQTIDGMPVTSWNNFSTVTIADDVMPVRIWGSLFSVEEIGLDKPILSVEEALIAMERQIDSIQIQEEMPLSVTKISLEYLAVMSSEGEPYIVPVWRFLLGNDEMERKLMDEKILAVNAVSGELIWEERGDTLQ